jgi:hypothetical protein
MNEEQARSLEDLEERVSVLEALVSDLLGNQTALGGFLEARHRDFAARVRAAREEARRRDAAQKERMP